MGLIVTVYRFSSLINKSLFRPARLPSSTGFLVKSIGLLGVLLSSSLALAQAPVEQQEIVPKEAIDVIWLGIAAALVFLMQMGFAFLESGSSRSKNCVNVMMKNFMDVCLGTLIYWAVGFGLMFVTSLILVPRPPAKITVFI